MKELESPAYYDQGRLTVDGVDLQAIAASVGTPTFVYSQAAIAERWRAYDGAFGGRKHQICYAVKANDNLSILKRLGELGAAFDIVSGGELSRVLAVDAEPGAIVFSGVGKTRAEIDTAIAAGVGCINIESETELRRVEAAASAHNVVLGIALRVNPDVDAKTHPYISTGLKENKFGVPIADAPQLYRRIQQSAHLTASGIACHIGSQLTTIAPVVDAVREVVNLAQVLSNDGIALEHIDVGGGLGISYQDETPPAIEQLISAICEVVPPEYTVVMEPGRSIVGKAGLLLTRVEYLKLTAAKNFVIVDAAMNDLLRPALYSAWHEVLTCNQSPAAETMTADVVGPVCESGDWLARSRELAVTEGDLIAILDTGAYAAVMSSQYNARPRACEVLVENGDFRVIRERESHEAMMANELAHIDR